MRRVFVAVGSNLGARAAHVARALRAVERGGVVRVGRTSSLYESPPKYVESQGAFLNAVVECWAPVSVSLEGVWDVLRGVEEEMQRDRSVQRNGPRNIDLDVLVDEAAPAGLETHQLSVPHPRIMERAFVLRPFRDLVGDDVFVDKDMQWTVQRAYDALGEMDEDADALVKVLPLDGDRVWRWSAPSARTWLMGIGNATPDSFSDGGRHGSVQDQVEHLAAMVRAGAAVIDVGGQSTRPGAERVSAEQELERVVPVIRGLRAHEDEEVARVPISIDTFYASVAREAVESGATIVNDVSAGLLDSAMLRTVAELDVPFVAMHMRGDPKTMSSEENTTYASGLVEGVREELTARVNAAEEAGIRRWNVIVDPGIGFAKTPAQQVELLQRLQDACPPGYPILSGPSRKGFIGRILKSSGVPYADVEDASSPSRQWGTAATVCKSIASGAHMVRVHDVEQMSAVRDVADVLWGTPSSP